MTPLDEFIYKLNKRGYAVGESDIRTDSIYFTYRDERFTFPTMRVALYIKPAGSFYLAKVKVLRKLAKENGHGDQA